MKAGEPSRTAQRVALRRAAHQLLDVPPVFEDPLALRMVGRERADALRDGSAGDGGDLGRYLRAFLAVRSRVAEDTLARLVTEGIGQYIILGAGLDTFAYRNPYPRLAVFEVDHPATQSWKRRRLEDEGLEPSGALRYVPVDFERQSLGEELERAGFRAESGAFFSWLGVTPYLAEEAVLATLAYVASVTAAGGGIVFDYGLPPTSLGPVQRLAFETMAARVRAAGEPWRTFFEPAVLSRRLHAAGFARVEDLSGAELNRRYFDARTDGLRVGGLGRIVLALTPKPAGPAPS